MPNGGSGLTFWAHFGPFFFEIHISIVGAMIISFLCLALPLISRFAGDALSIASVCVFWQSFILAKSDISWVSDRSISATNIFGANHFNTFIHFIVPGTT